MINARRLRTVLALTLVSFALFPALASAQATRTWVSGVGDDVNPCSRTAPCKTFAGAISKTASSGIISVLDPGGFGVVTITKPITIDGGGMASISNTGGVNGIVINQSTTSGPVILRNLTIDGGGTTLGARGIFVTSAGAPSVRVQNVDIGFQSNAGIGFEPSSSAKLVVVDSNLSDGTGDGMRVKAPTTGAAGTASRVTVSNSTITSNGGDAVDSDGGSNADYKISTRIYRSLLSDSGDTAVKSSGRSTVRITRNDISGNGTGLAALTLGVFTGSILSSMDNAIGSNTVDGAPTGTAPLAR